MRPGRTSRGEITTSATRPTALVGLILLAAALSACDEDPVHPPPLPVVSVIPSAMTLEVGEDRLAGAIVQGSRNQNVIWRSGDAAVATVNNQGRVVGVAPGLTVIVAVSVQDTIAKGATAVTVVARSVPVVAVTPNSIEVEVGQTVSFSAAVTGTTNTAVTWRSSNPAVGEVDNAGVATALSPGVTVITAVAQADTTAKGTAELRVTEPTGVITGSVFRADNSSPMANVLLTAGGQTATTDAAGEYRLEVVAPGDYTVSITGGVPAGLSCDSPRQVQVIPALTATANFVCAPTPAGLVITPTSVAATHRVGMDPCPQLLSSLVLKNETNEELTYLVLGDAVAMQRLDIAGGGTGVVAANGTRTLGILFNCSTTVSFNTWIEVISKRDDQEISRTRIDITVSIP